jgi:UDP-N-acetylmuramoyl-tripeptide--D-alanyl-D-alanine ligase
MNIPLREVAAVLGHACGSDAVVTGWSVDSRTLQPGDLFFALRGPHHDGHQYATRVMSCGAAAAVVEQPIPGGGPFFQVPGTLQALQQLASWARQRWGGDVTGLTGSAGKTTTKETIAALLSVALPVGKTVGNFNNHVGVPLSILRLPDHARAAVLELGMNHAGEIRELAQIARPRIGVVTNVGYAHVENFAEGIEGIAAAKRELIESLPAGGIAVLNADDPRVAAMAAGHPGTVITYGIAQPADVRATGVQYSRDGVRFQVDGVAFHSPVLGRHSVLNILAALAVAQLYGLALHQLTAAVAQLAPPPMRGQLVDWQGLTLLDDCYNSNPDAARAMLDTLGDLPAARRIAVLGEMRELGPGSERLHREVGAYAAQAALDLIIGVRGDAAALVDEARRYGARTEFFATPEEAGDFLAAGARPGDLILFKGSRGTQVERALQRLQHRSGGGA